MTICKTAYDTTACGGFLLKKTTDAITAALVSSHVPHIPKTIIGLIEGGSAQIDNVPAFAHPIIYSGAGHNGPPGDVKLIIDVRSFGSWDSAQTRFNVRNEIEYKLAVHRAELNQIWITENSTILRDISQLPIVLFSSWVSEAIAKRFALDPREQLNLTILAAIFYNSQFTNEEKMDDHEKLRAINSIAKALRASSQDVMSIFDNVSYVPNVATFCQLAQTISGSVRLSDLNVGLLYSIVGSTWFGTNSKEMVAVAMEHPPTWLAILMAAYSERTFKNSAITKLTERTGNKDSGKGYLHAILNLLNIFKD